MRKFVMGLGCALLFWVVLSLVFGVLYGLVIAALGIEMNIYVCAIAGWIFIICGFVFGIIKG